MTAETETVLNTTKTFKYSFPTCTNDDILFKLEVPIQIPHDGSTRELVQRVINMFHIPVYLEDELNEKLAKFVSEETENFHNERDEKLLNQLKNSELNVEGIVKNWEKAFKDNVMEFAEQKGTSDEEVFAAAYHKLVHSPALETILSVENSYAKTYMELKKTRDEDIKQLTARQTEEMEEKVSQLNITTTEEQINQLAVQHFEEQALLSGKWDSQLDALWHTQRNQFRSWLMHTLRDYQTTNSLNTPTNSPLATFPPPAEAPPPASLPRSPRPPRLEESFTIHLGSQLKQTHNIRLVAADLFDLCDTGYFESEAACSSRLQSALSLYAPEVCGGVVAAERPAPPPAPPDHHFAPAPAQLERATRALGRRRLAAGDVVVTVHSNLPELHALFHLVTETRGARDISSRAAPILGLRNVLRAACAHDVTSLALPLLLAHELSEEMTVPWCVRRAELVLKCVKGFMVEGAGGGGAALRTLSALLPPRTPPALFAALAQLPPAVFRLASPLYARSHDP